MTGPSSRLVQRLAVATLVGNVLIVVTGGAVRLTASGLGCPTWPTCTEQSLVNSPELGIHGYVEFGNRLLTVALAVVAVLTVVAALTTRPRRRDVTRLAVAVACGIPLQAVIGGVTVLTDLNPWVVMLHFLASMLLVGLATALVERSREGDGPARLVVPPAARGLVLGVLAALAVVLYLGTVVTGSGPHAGDAAARRTGLDPEAMSQLHADGVFLLAGLTIGLYVALRASASPRRAQLAALTLLGLELGQGLVGFTQYATALPVPLVGLHMLGAAVLVTGAVHLLMVTRERAPIVVQDPASPPRSWVPAIRSHS